jgi:hypothetical protein
LEDIFQVFKQFFGKKLLQVMVTNFGIECLEDEVFVGEGDKFLPLTELLKFGDDGVPVLRKCIQGEDFTEELVCGEFVQRDC